MGHRLEKIFTIVSCFPCYWSIFAKYINWVYQLLLFLTNCSSSLTKNECKIMLIFSVYTLDISTLFYPTKCSSYKKKKKNEGKIKFLVVELSFHTAFGWSTLLNLFFFLTKCSSSLTKEKNICKTKFIFPLYKLETSTICFHFFQI